MLDRLVSLVLHPERRLEAPQNSLPVARKFTSASLSSAHFRFQPLPPQKFVSQCDSVSAATSKGILALYGQRVYAKTWMPGAEKPDFDWDDANVDHIERHAVTPAEAEQVVTGASFPLYTEERGGEERHTELGETRNGRLLVVVWTWRGQKIRVVTAFSAGPKWRSLWYRLRKGGSNV